VPVSGDASFRRYFRLQAGEQAWICVDAPPDKEDTGACVRMAELLDRHQILAPKVLSFDLAQGFMLLTDLGDRLLLNTLTPETVDRQYEQAMGTLLKLQQVPLSELSHLPRMDSGCLHAELDLFEAWFLPQYLQIAADAHLVQVLQSVYDQLTKSALSQPQVLVHRDYHSRNLMWVAGERLAQIDFQDAVVGPITYDLVSLLRDCYVVWPTAQVRTWAQRYADQVQAAGIVQPVAAEDWQRWFDWVGLQRHLRVLGVFARLNFRDGKANYLNDIPLTMRYVYEVVQAYPQFSTFQECLEQTILPALYRVNPQAQRIVETADLFGVAASYRVHGLEGEG
jgi:aminoglycoside/choline kinase family phosphotransferase